MKKILFFVFIFLTGCSWFINENKFSSIYLWYMDQFDLSLLRDIRLENLNENIELDLSWTYSIYTGDISLNINNFYENTGAISSTLSLSWFINQKKYSFVYDLFSLKNELYLFPKEIISPDFNQESKNKFINNRRRINKYSKVLNKFFFCLYLKDVEDTFDNIKNFLKNNPILKENWIKDFWNNISYYVKIDNKNYFTIKNKYKLQDLTLTWIISRVSNWYMLDLQRFEFWNFWGSGTVSKYEGELFLASDNLKDNRFMIMNYTCSWNINCKVLLQIYDLKKKIWYINLDIVKVYLEKGTEIDIKGQVKLDMMNINFILKYKLSVWDKKILSAPYNFQDIEKQF